jgi:hypothetical protein
MAAPIVSPPPEADAEDDAYRALLRVMHRVLLAKYTDANWKQNEELRIAVRELRKGHERHLHSAPLATPGCEYVTEMMAAIVDPRFYFITDGRGAEIEMFTRGWALAHLAAIYELS